MGEVADGREDDEAPTIVRDTPVTPSPLLDHADASGSAIGRRFGKYWVVDLLGTGGMGAVYRAVDRDLDREVALKVLSARPRSADDTQHESARLLREARAQAQVSHPNVVAIYDVGTEAGEVYLAMELVEGRHVAAWLREGPRPWPEVLDVFVQAGRGLVAAHERGLVHRDFKPSNVLLGVDGRARVSDFGLARLADAEAPPSSRSSAGGPEHRDPRLTQAGTVVGTPAYMAPEQHGEGALGPAIDQYAFCVALWEALAGHNPFAGATIQARVRAKHEGPPPPPAGSEVPGWVWRALARGLQPRAEARHPSMQALLAALGRARSHRLRWGLAGVVALAGVVGVAALLPEPAPSRCVVDDAALAGQWDDEIRAQAQQAFEGSGRGYGLEAFLPLAAHLDRYAAAWIEQRRDACESNTPNDVALDLRMACLDEARDALGHLGQVLVRADGTTVDRASQLGSTLPPLERCADVDALTRGSRDASEGPLGPEGHALRGELTGLQALRAAGRFEEAVSEADRLAPRVAAVGRATMSADLWTHRAKALEGLGRHQEAHDDLQRALAAAQEAHDDHRIARVSVWLAWNVGSYLSRSREGLTWLRTAEAALARTDDDPDLRAELLNCRAVLAMDLGQLDESAEALTAAIALIEAHDGPDAAQLGGALVNLAIVEGRRGDHERALALQRRALELRERHQGRDHPDTVAALNNLSTSLVALGRHEEGLRANEQARQRLVRGLGDRHPLLATIRVGRGVALFAQGRIDEAAEQMQLAAELQETLLGPDHRDLAVIHGNIGYLHLERSRPDLARRSFERAVAVLETNGARDQPEALAALAGLAKALDLDGAPVERARELWDSVVARMEAGQRGGIDVAGTYRDAADFYARIGEPERAAQLERLAAASVP